MYIRNDSYVFVFLSITALQTFRGRHATLGLNLSLLRLEREADLSRERLHILLTFSLLLQDLERVRREVGRSSARWADLDLS